MAAIGRKGGQISGKRRLKTMTAEQRRKVARKAAKTRWRKAKNNQGSPSPFRELPGFGYCLGFRYCLQLSRFLLLSLFQYLGPRLASANRKNSGLAQNLPDDELRKHTPCDCR